MYNAYGKNYYRYQVIIRKQDFNRHYNEVKAILTHYINQHEEKKDGWYKKVVKFNEDICKIEEGFSLFALKEAIIKFSDTLRSKANYVSSLFFSDASIKLYGGYVGVGGSSLKERLEAIANNIDPLNAKYILNEIRINLNAYRNLNAGYMLSAYDFMSPHNIQAMEIIVKDPSMERIFMEQVQDARSQGLGCLFSTDKILEDFKERHPINISERNMP